MNALLLALEKHVTQQEAQLEEYWQHLRPHLIHCEITERNGFMYFEVVDPSHRNDFWLDGAPFSLRYDAPEGICYLAFKEGMGGTCMAKTTNINIGLPSAQTPDFRVRIGTEFCHRHRDYYLTVRADEVELGFVGGNPSIKRFPRVYDPKIKETFVQFLEKIGYPYTSA